jgi:hypothetical protein
MPDTQTRYWNNSKVTQFLHLWTSLTHMETLKSIVECLTVHYNKAEPVVARETSVPALHQIQQNVSYQLMINQQPVSPKGSITLFYKYTLDGAGRVVLGIGTTDTFHAGRDHPVYGPTYSTNTTTILKDWAGLPGVTHAPLCFTFLLQQPHQMHVVVETCLGTLLWQVLDLRYFPPMVVYSWYN